MSGIGLAYKTPEQEAALRLDSEARSLTMPMKTPGIGMATVPQIPTQQPVIDPRENPAGAFGLVLQSVGAGLEGKESPVIALQKQKAEQQEQEVRTAALAMEVVDKTGRFVSKLPKEQRKEAIADLDARFSGALGGHSIAPFLTAITAGDEAETQSTLEALKLLNPSPQMLSYWSSHPEEGVKALAKYNEARATEKPLDRIEAEAEASTKGANTANKDKPMTPAETAADARAREANAASRDNAAATREAAGMQRKTSQENTLRSEFTTQSKEFVTVKGANQKIQQAAKDAGKDKTGATDMSLVFSYMKLLDPNSTVREGEYASAANSGGVGNRIINAYNAAREGKVLTETQRKDFATQAQRMYTQAEKNHISLRRDYSGKAKNTGADPSNVIVDYVGVPVVDSDEDYKKLPKGAEFIDPHGDRRKKP